MDKENLCLLANIPSANVEIVRFLQLLESYITDLRNVTNFDQFRLHATRSAPSIAPLFGHMDNLLSILIYLHHSLVADLNSFGTIFCRHHNLFEVTFKAFALQYHHQSQAEVHALEKDRAIMSLWHTRFETFGIDDLMMRIYKQVFEITSQLGGIIKALPNAHPDRQHIELAYELSKHTANELNQRAERHSALCNLQSQFKPNSVVMLPQSIGDFGKRWVVHQDYNVKLLRGWCVPLTPPLVLRKASEYSGGPLDEQGVFKDRIEGAKDLHLALLNDFLIVSQRGRRSLRPLCALSLATLAVPTHLKTPELADAYASKVDRLLIVADNNGSCLYLMVENAEQWRAAVDKAIDDLVATEPDVAVVRRSLHLAEDEEGCFVTSIMPQLRKVEAAPQPQYQQEEQHQKQEQHAPEVQRNAAPATPVKHRRGLLAGVRNILSPAKCKSPRIQTPRGKSVLVLGPVGTPSSAPDTPGSTTEDVIDY